MSYQSISITKTRQDEYFLNVTEFGGWRGVFAQLWGFVPEICCKYKVSYYLGLQHLFHGIETKIWKWSELEGNTIKVAVYKEDYDALSDKWDRIYGG